VKIASVSGNTITLTAAVTKNHATGESVVEVAAATPTATPRAFPTTGGSNGSGDTGLWLLLLLMGGGLLVAAGGTALAARTVRKD
jgi:hypothetical protein